MSDPLVLSAEAIAVLVATKALEKTGEKLSETTFNLVGEFLTSLKRKDPNTAATIEKVAQQRELGHKNPIDYNLDSLIEKVIAASKNDLELKRDIEVLADSVKNLKQEIQGIAKTILNKSGNISTTGNISNLINVSNPGNVGNINIKTGDIKTGDKNDFSGSFFSIVNHRIRGQDLTYLLMFGTFSAAILYGALLFFGKVNLGSWIINIVPSPTALTVVNQPTPKASPSFTLPLESSSPSPSPSQDLTKKKDIEVSQTSPSYEHLEYFLKNKQWEKADLETLYLTLYITGRATSSFRLRYEEIQEIPCDDLRKLDQLWIAYSNGRFGFSKQRDIYLSVGGHAGGQHEREAWEKFGSRVGWKQSKGWIISNKMNFISSAAVGHFPAISYQQMFPLSPWNNVWLPSLVSHLGTCNI
jgi:GUN4-like